jgi:mersacidin/lichenicidin family type 2 lantibiotic
MNRDQIIRAWKDEDYRSSLGPAELSALPENPAGLVELSEDEVARAHGNEENPTFLLPTLCMLLCAISYFYSKSEGGTCALNTLGCCKAVEIPA